MATTKHESHIGKEDFELQTDTDTPGTFERQTSTGAKITMTRFPDLWDGTGLLNVGKFTVRALDDNDTILHSFGGTS